MNLIRKFQYKVMPWKNGLGSTAEIARFPVEEPYTWRLSQATITKGSAFSSFPGFERLVAIVKGDGIRLNGEEVSGKKVIKFSGDRDSSCELLGGEVQDLGLIYDSKQVEAEMVFVSGLVEIKRAGIHFFYNLKTGDTLRIDELGSIKVEPSIHVSICQ